jgi:hypothetical protein
MQVRSAKCVCEPTKRQRDLGIAEKHPAIALLVSVRQGVRALQMRAVWRGRVDSTVGVVVSSNSYSVAGVSAVRPSIKISLGVDSVRKCLLYDL